MIDSYHERTRSGWLLRPLLVLALIAPACLWGATSGDRIADEGGSTMELKSRAFDQESKIPVRYTCDGVDLSPPLAWSGVPDGVRSFVLIMDDPDAPPGTWVHWVLYDLPADLRGLAEGVAKSETVEGGGRHGLCWGVESFSRVGYYGPCPPPGPPHRYSFRLYALGERLDLSPKATKKEVIEAMKGHVLAEAELIGLYER